MTYVSLTYDDALQSHFRSAMELSSRKLRGTFFVNTGTSGFRKNESRWKDVMKSDHEIANHTFSHPVPKEARWAVPGNTFEELGESGIEREISRGVETIMELGCSAVPSFAYPCGITTMGKFEASYIHVVSKFHKFARLAGGGTMYGPDAKEHVRNTRFEIPGVEASRAGDLVDRVNAIGDGGWLVLYFHGIDEGNMSVSTETHNNLLNYLSSKKSEIVTDTFGNVAEKLSKL